MAAGQAVARRLRVARAARGPCVLCSGARVGAICFSHLVVTLGFIFDLFGRGWLVGARKYRSPGIQW